MDVCTNLYGGFGFSSSGSLNLLIRCRSRLPEQGGAVEDICMHGSKDTVLCSYYCGIKATDEQMQSSTTLVVFVLVAAVVLPQIYLYLALSHISTAHIIHSLHRVSRLTAPAPYGHLT